MCAFVFVVVCVCVSEREREGSSESESERFLLMREMCQIWCHTAEISLHKYHLNDLLQYVWGSSALAANSSSKPSSVLL